MTDPYPDDRAYVRDELARLDCRLRIEVDRFEGSVDEFGALYVSRRRSDGCSPGRPRTSQVRTTVAPADGPTVE